MKLLILSICLLLAGTIFSQETNSNTRPSIKVYLAATGDPEQIPAIIDKVADYLSERGISARALGSSPKSRVVAVDEMNEKHGEYLLFLALDFGINKNLYGSLKISAFDTSGKLLWQENVNGSMFILTASSYINGLTKKACEKIESHIGKEGLPTDINSQTKAKAQQIETETVNTESKAPDKIVEPAKPVEPPATVVVSTSTTATTTAPVKISDPAVEALCLALNQENTGKVIDALKNLRKFKSAESVPSILPCLTNQNPNIVREACRTLAVTGTKNTVPALEPLLMNPRGDIRDEAYKAITKLQSE